MTSDQKATKAIKVINQLNLPINGWIKLAINTFSLMVSWYFNKSILWGIFHFIFGIWYLIYRLIKGSFKDGGLMEVVNFYF